MTLNNTNCIFFMIDIQTKLLNAMNNKEGLIKQASILNKAAEILEVPVVISEQYVKGLGHTDDNIYMPTNTNVYEKTQFSVFTEEITKKLEELDKTNIVFYGIESHICVTQSALEAINKGFNVFIASDAISSRNVENIKLAFGRLEKAGCIIASTEMILFEILKDAKNPKFKDISRLIK